MRIFISVDMEGATGIVHNDQLMPGRADWARGRELLTGDVKVAAEAALSMDDVEYVRICDGHGCMRNILLERLPMNCEVVLGPASSKTLCQCEGLDDTFQAAMFVGYHARAGTAGAVLPHTWVGSLIHEVRVNGRVFGETAINAALAGEYGVPVVFLSGDLAACNEAAADLGRGLITVPVKRGTGPKAALCRTPADTEADIRLGVLTALQDLSGAKPFKVDPPVEFTIEFHERARADKAAKREGIERSGERAVTVLRPSYLEAVREAWQVVEWTANDLPEWLQ